MNTLIILIPIIIIGIVMVIVLVTLQNKTIERNIYVHIKTQSRYKLISNCKIKHPKSIGWYDGVIYVSLNTGHTYVREKKEFNDKFVTLKEFETNKKYDLKYDTSR